MREMMRLFSSSPNWLGAFWCHGEQTKLEVEREGFWLGLLYQVSPSRTWGKSPPSLPGLPIALKAELWKLLMIKFLVPLTILGFPPFGIFITERTSPRLCPHTPILTFVESAYFTIKTHTEFNLFYSPPPFFLPPPLFLFPLPLPSPLLLILDLSQKTKPKPEEHNIHHHKQQLKLFQRLGWCVNGLVHWK